MVLYTFVLLFLQMCGPHFMTCSPHSTSGTGATVAAQVRMGVQIYSFIGNPQNFIKFYISTSSPYPDPSIGSMLFDLLRFAFMLPNEYLTVRRKVRPLRQRSLVCS